VAESDNAIFDEAECALPPSAFLEAALLRWARLLDRRLHQVRKQVIKAKEIENLARQSQRFVVPGEMELTECARQWLGEEAKVGSPVFVSLHACLGLHAQSCQASKIPLTVSKCDESGQRCGSLIVDVERPHGVTAYSCRRPDTEHPPRVVSRDFTSCSCGRTYDKGLPCGHVQYVLGSDKCEDRKLPEEVALPYYRLSVQSSLYERGSFMVPDFTRLRVAQDLVPPPARPPKKGKRGPKGPRASKAALQNEGGADEQLAREEAELNGMREREGPEIDPSAREDVGDPVTVTVSHEVEAQGSGDTYNNQPGEAGYLPCIGDSATMRIVCL
jgi:hypothetical protein